MFGKQMPISALALVATCLLGFFTSSTMAQVPSQVDSLSSTCLAELNEMWALYTAPTTWTEACDPQCLLNCNEMLQDAIYSSTSKDCPHQDDITRCFNIYAAEWENYIAECPLFKFSEECAEGEADGEGEGCAEGEAEAEGASEGTAEAEAYAPGAAPAEAEAVASEAEAEAEGASEATAPSSATTTETAGEAEAEAEAVPAPAEAEGATETTTSSAEGEASPTPAAETFETEASSEATPASSSEGASEAEGGRRRLLEGEGESEAEASGSGQGCFPKFKVKSDFTVYMSGLYFDTMYSKDESTVGIIMSVCFWLGLASVGVMVRH